MTAFAFPYIELPDFPTKPRVCGVTSILDKGLGAERVHDLLEVAGSWIDVAKFGWATARVQPQYVIQAKIAAYRAANVAPCTGGTFLELAYAQGKADAFLREAFDLGFLMAEVSNGVYPMSGEEKADLIHLVRRVGLVPWSEVGKKDPAEDAKLSLNDRLSAVTRELDAGAEKVILEARESGSVGIFDRQGKPQTELLHELVTRFGSDPLVFEAPRKEQQLWMIRNFGPTVNLGNIAAEEAVPLATLRTGLRGDTFAEFHLHHLSNMQETL